MRKLILIVIIIILCGVATVGIISLFAKSDSEGHFWKWFSAHSDEYYNYPAEKQEILFDKISKELMKVNQGLTFEFGPIDSNGKRELVISADGIRSVFPSVISLVKKAPKFEKWKITAFRQRMEDYEIQFGKVKLGRKDVLFTYEKDGNKIDITLFVNGYQKSGEYDQAVYLLLDSILGEYDVETQIGCIDINPQNGRENSLLSISELPKIVDTNKKGK
jgi:hypothetical protein